MINREKKRVIKRGKGSVRERKRDRQREREINSECVCERERGEAGGWKTALIILSQI